MTVQGLSVYFLLWFTLLTCFSQNQESSFTDTQVETDDHALPDDYILMPEPNEKQSINLMDDPQNSGELPPGRPDDFPWGLRIETLKSLGEISISHGNFIQAENYFNEVLSIGNSLNDSALIAISYLKIGTINQKKGLPSNAREQFYKSLNFLITDETSDDIPVLIKLIAETYIKEEKYDDCKAFLKDNLEIAQKAGGNYYISHLFNIGICDLSARRMPEALEYFHKSLNYSLLLGYPEWSIKNHLEIGGLLLSMNDLAGSYTHLKQAENLAIENNNLNELSRAYYTLSAVYEARGNESESLAYLQKYFNINDSLFSLDKERQLKEIHEWYETVRIDQDIAALNQEKQFKDQQIKTQRILLWGFALGISILSVLGVLLYSQNKRQKQTNMELVRMNMEIVEQEKEIIKKIAEMESEISLEKKKMINLSDVYSKSLSALFLEVELLNDDKGSNDYQEAFHKFMQNSREILQAIKPSGTLDDYGHSLFDKKNLDPDTSESEDGYLTNQILDVMENSREFLEVGFSLEQLANIVGAGKKEVSAIINKKFGHVFNSFVNKYRIKEARKMLLSEEYENYTIEAIAQEVGFKSKSSFNLYFKNVTGLTPSVFQKTVKMANFNSEKTVKAVKKERG